MEVDPTFRIVVLALAVVFLFAYLLRRSSRREHDRQLRKSARRRTRA
jgi:hypothetical protein